LHEQKSSFGRYTPSLLILPDFSGFVHFVADTYLMVLLAGICKQAVNKYNKSGAI